MILSSRNHRNLLRAFNPARPRDHDLPDPDAVFADPDLRARDLDWAIREIVDDVLFETAR